MKSRSTNMRREYSMSALDETSAHRNPFEQFRIWFEEATVSSVVEPNAMIVATVDDRGQPSQRTVLLKSFDDAGFVFYTNLASRKGEELSRNPRVALLFYWAELERQVRVTGTGGHVPDAEADAYWALRPRGSQVGSFASPQSQVIPDRAWLAREFARVEERYRDHAPVARPDHWGGIRVAPEEFEFWQGRPNRLHDRLRYRREAGSWRIERLAP